MTAGKRLAGRTCVITGASGELGAATVRRFIAEGASVVAVDRAALAFAADTNVAAEQGDVADEAFIREVVERHADADILVAYAAVSKGGTVEETEQDDWSEILQINVIATALWIRSMLPAMRRSRRGSVVTVGSQLALAGGSGNISYIASKGAILALTRSVALDHAVDNVRCNCLVPGAIDSPLLRQAFARAAYPQAAEAGSLARHPLGRFGTSEEVANAALYLASDESSFTTGAVLPVDGGWLAG